MFDNQMSSNRQVVFDYINENVIFRCDPTKKYNEELVGKLPSKNPSGNGYASQFLMRRLTHNVKMMSIVMEMLEPFIDSIIESDDGFQLCGMETGSLPIIAALQSHIKILYGEDINAFTVRKERKAYGLFNYIEGEPNDLPVVYVDDVVNSGSSIGRCANIVEREIGNLKCAGVWAIVSKRVDVQSLYNWNDFDLEYDKDLYWEPKGLLT